MVFDPMIFKLQSENILHFSLENEEFIIKYFVFYIAFLKISCYKRTVLYSTHFFNVGYAGIPGRPQPLIAAF